MPDTTRIRDYQPSDAEGLVEIFRRSVSEIGCRDYSDDQVRVWLMQGPTAKRLQDLSADGRVRLVAVDSSDTLLAFADLEADGHIDLLYCAPEAVGLGVASTLYDHLEKRAREQGMKRLYSEASEAARRFFLKKNFVVIHRRDMQIADVDIHNYAVEKLLLPAIEGNTDRQ
ncbi:MAG: GNAT family N-acetyltransferase [Pseudomonadota bacterium]